MTVLLLYKIDTGRIISFEYVDYGLYLVLKPLLQLKNLDFLGYDPETNSKIYFEAVTASYKKQSFDEFNYEFKQFHADKHAENANMKVGKLIQDINIEDFSNIIAYLDLETEMDSWIGKSTISNRFDIFKLLIEKFGVQDKDLIFEDIYHFTGSEFLNYFLDRFPEYMNDVNDDIKSNCLNELVERGKLKMVKTLLRFNYQEDNYDIISLAVQETYDDKHQTEILRLLLEDSRFPIANNIFETIDTGSPEIDIELAKTLLNDVRAPTSKTDLNQVSAEIKPLIEEDLCKYPTTKIRKVNFPLDQEINQLSIEIDKLENLSHSEENEVFRMGYDIVRENLLLQINELNSVKLFTSA